MVMCKNIYFLFLQPKKILDAFVFLENYKRNPPFFRGEKWGGYGCEDAKGQLDDGFPCVVLHAVVCKKSVKSAIFAPHLIVSRSSSHSFSLLIS